MWVETHSLYLAYFMYLAYFAYLAWVEPYFTYFTWIDFMQDARVWILQIAMSLHSCLICNLDVTSMTKWDLTHANITECQNTNAGQNHYQPSWHMCSLNIDTKYLNSRKYHIMKVLHMLTHCYMMLYGTMVWLHLCSIRGKFCLSYSMSPLQ